MKKDQQIIIKPTASLGTDHKDWAYYENIREQFRSISPKGIRVRTSASGYDSSEPVNHVHHLTVARDTGWGGRGGLHVEVAYCHDSSETKDYDCTYDDILSGRIIFQEIK
jgi:hypothetical protein